MTTPPFDPSENTAQHTPPVGGQAALQAFLDAAFALPTDTTDDHTTDADRTPSDIDVPVRAVNWNLVTAEEAAFEWHDLDTWVSWLRRDFGLPVQEVPPFWHRHRELVWELSALHTAWLAAYSDDAPANAPLLWLRDLGESRRRLTDWVQKSGTALTTDRPTRQTAWPGEPPHVAEQVTITDRAADFYAFVEADLARRRREVAAGENVARGGE